MRTHPAHIVLCGIFVGVVPAQAELSPSTRDKIQTGLPAFHPEQAAKETEAKPHERPAPLSDDPLVNLPNFHVEDRRLAGVHPDDMLGKVEKEKKALQDYRNGMTQLEWLLNCWHIPFLTPSAQARANATYADKRINSEFTRLARLADVIGKTDPAAAAKLKQALDPSKLPDSK